MENFKHVIQFFNQYTFKLTINGERVIPLIYWPTRGPAAFFAELSKWYYREVFRLDHHTVRIAPNVSPESLLAEASKRGIDLSKPAEVFSYLPKGIQTHITRNLEQLEDFAALNLNTDFRRAVSSALTHLQNAASDVRQAVGKTEGSQKEFLENALGVFVKYADEFERCAVSAAKKATDETPH